MKRICAAVFAACLLFPASFAQKARKQEPAPVPLAGESVLLTASDGWKISAVYSKPPEGKYVFILLHSMGKDKSDWGEFAQYLGAAGLGYFAIDLRGHGDSRVGTSGAEVSYKDFRRNGMDNEFNQMTRDVSAAVDYLVAQGIKEDRIAIAGSGLGANLAIKTAAVYPNIAMIALFTPTLNANRDVLAVNPMRAYGKRPVLIVSGTDQKRIFGEVSIIRNIAQLSAGKNNVTFITAYKGTGSDLITKEVAGRVIQWVHYPAIPETVTVSTAAVQASSGAAVAVSTAPANGSTEKHDDITDEILQIAN